MKTVQAADPGGAGQVISEAILLPAGLLVAAGERGVHLLTPDGHTKARWDVPATSLTIADDGAAALIVGRGARAYTFELHRVDLVSHELTRLPSLAGHGVAATFDGRTVTPTTACTRSTSRRTRHATCGPCSRAAMSPWRSTSAHRPTCRRSSASWRP